MTTGARAAMQRAPSMAVGLFRLARPKQWIKNLLVFAAPGAAGVVLEADALWRTTVAAVAFCLAASGTYYLNDVADAAADRRHPTKWSRPVASGLVPMRVAQVAGAVLVASAIGVSAVTGRWELPLVLAVYVAMTTSYTLWSKHVAVLDIVTVAAGFVLRALAGAAATGVPVSHWFLLVASFGSLFMVAGKRSAELEASGDVVRQRRVLADYPPQFLIHVRAVASGVTLLAYCLWAFEQSDLADGSVWYQTVHPALCHRDAAVLVPLGDRSRGRAGGHRAGRPDVAGGGTRLDGDLRPRCLPVTRQLLTGWGRTAATAADTCVPPTVTDLTDAVRGAGTRGAIARGMGRSYGDQALNAGGAVIDCRALSGITADLDAGTVVATGGTTLDELMRRFVPTGLVRPGHARYQVRHGRRCDRQRHPRQEPPRGRQLRPTRRGDDVAPAVGRAPRRRPRQRTGPLLGDRRRDGAHRHRPRRHHPDVAHLDVPAARRHREDAGSR